MGGPTIAPPRAHLELLGNWMGYEREERMETAPERIAPTYRMNGADKDAHMAEATHDRSSRPPRMTGCCLGGAATMAIPPTSA